MAEELARPRPITALCFGGPLHGEVFTCLSDTDIVDVPGQVAPGYSHPPITRYLANRMVLPITTTEVLEVHVLVEQLGYYGDQAKLFTIIAGLIMLMRGWPGPDEGERWTVTALPLGVTALIAAARR